MSAGALLRALMPLHCRLIQFADRGCWERARRFEIPGEISALRASLDRLLDMEDPAIELFFRLPDGRRCFLGLRQSASVPGADRLDRALAQLLAGRLPVTFGLAREWLVRLCGEGVQPFSRAPDFLECGILDFWASAGPAVIWRGSGQGWSPALLDGLPAHLVASNLNPIVLEAGYCSPLPYWLGLEVSRQTGDGHWRHQLDLPLARRTAAAVLAVA